MRSVETVTSSAYSLLLLFSSSHFLDWKKEFSPCSSPRSGRSRLVYHHVREGAASSDKTLQLLGVLGLVQDPGDHKWII